MRGLTLTRPWPWAILDLPPSLAKRIENRPTRFPHHLLNTEIALHAGKVFDEDAVETITRIAGRAPPTWPDCPVGIVGVCKVINCFDQTDGYMAVISGTALPFPEEQRRWFFGSYGWLLADVRKLAHPVPCRGMQGLWPVPAEIEASVRHQLDG